MGSLPAHGLIACRACWSGCGTQSERTLDGGRFRLVNDPGAWGSKNPEILVLGMTKGNTQSDAMSRSVDDGTFDGVAFHSFRPNLLMVLQSVGLLPGVSNINPLFRAEEKRFAWGSISRCSLTGFDKKSGNYSGQSGSVLPGFTSPEGSPVVETCIRTFLTDLPAKTRLVILLGNAENYLKKIYTHMSKVFPDYRRHPELGDVVFKAGGRPFVHVGHPSPLNGHLREFVMGDATTGQGMKRMMAAKAVAHALR